MRSLSSLLICFILFFLSSASYAQSSTIPVTLPEVASTSENVAIPMTIGDVTGLEITAFLLTLSYDPAIIEITHINTNGLLAEGFSIIQNGNTPGQITIAGAGSSALSGEGDLLRLHARFIGSGESTLSFNSFIFNEGQPEAGTTDGAVSNTGTVSAEDDGGLPASFELEGNYPNPFNPTTNIRFSLPEAASVQIEVMDMLGRRVLDVPQQMLPAGQHHEVQIDASSLASGTYLYRIMAQGASDVYVKAATMTLLK